MDVIKVYSDMVSAAGMAELVIAAFPTVNAQIEDLGAQEFVSGIKMNDLPKVRLPHK